MAINDQYKKLIGTKLFSCRKFFKSKIRRNDSLCQKNKISYRNQRQEVVLAARCLNGEFFFLKIQFPNQLLVWHHNLVAYCQQNTNLALQRSTFLYTPTSIACWFWLLLFIGFIHFSYCQSSHVSTYTLSIVGQAMQSL